MQIPLQITLRDVEHSEALETHIRDKAKKLDEFFQHIISCRVVVEVPHRHHHQGKHYNVRIDIGVPGNEIAINRDRAEDVYVAVRDAFDAAKRQLEDYARKIRGDIKKHEPKRASIRQGEAPEEETVEDATVEDETVEDEALEGEVEDQPGKNQPGTSQSSKR